MHSRVSWRARCVWNDSFHCFEISALRGKLKRATVLETSSACPATADMELIPHGRLEQHEPQAMDALARRLRLRLAGRRCGHELFASRERAARTEQ